MNPPSDASSVGGQAPQPVHTHELTSDEVLELGGLALEEPHENAAAVAPMGIPAVSPLPPTTVVAPQPQPSAPVPEVATDTAQPSPSLTQRGVVQPLTTAVQQTTPAPATPTPEVVPPPQPAQPPVPNAQAAATTPPATADKSVPDQPADAAPAEVAAPKSTPSKAPDVIPPDRPAPLVQQEVDNAKQPVSPNPPSTSERMELSANTMNLKSISRLRTIGVAMNVIVIVLIVGIIAGGWYVYTHVLHANGTAIF